MHQNILPSDIFFFKTTMRLHFCILNGDRQVFHGDMIIIIRVFSSLLYHCYIQLMFSVDKNPLGPYKDPMYQSRCKYGR